MLVQARRKNVMVTLLALLTMSLGPGAAANGDSVEIGATFAGKIERVERSVAEKMSAGSLSMSLLTNSSAMAGYCSVKLATMGLNFVVRVARATGGSVPKVMDEGLRQVAKEFIGIYRHDKDAIDEILKNEGPACRLAFRNVITVSSEIATRTGQQARELTDSIGSN